MIICKFCDAQCDTEWTQKVHHACCGRPFDYLRGSIPYSLMPVIGELLRDENKRLVDESIEYSMRNGSLLLTVAELRARIAELEEANRVLGAIVDAACEKAGGE